MLFSPSRCTRSSPQPIIIKKTDASVGCPRGQVAIFHNHMPNLGRYICRFNSHLTCCMIFGCTATVCAADSKSQEAVVLPDVFHSCLRERMKSEQGVSLTCMKYRFTSLKGKVINWSFSKIVSQNCCVDVLGLAQVVCETFLVAC